MLQMIFTVTMILGIVLNLISFVYDKEKAKIIRGYGWSMIAVGILLTAVFWS